jgi:uncharacterized protein (DUF433 family)
MPDMLPAPAAKAVVGRRDVQALGTHHEPMQADELQSFGGDDVAAFAAARRRKCSRVFRQREWGNLDTCITGCADRAARVVERPILEDLVANGVAQVRHEASIVMCDNRAMAAIDLVDTIPLAQDAQGVYRIGATRVTLDLVVRAFNRGATAEEIVQKFPSLQLPDVYQVIGYYLKHSAELGAYFERREHREKELLDAHRDEWSPRGLRERLLSRRKNM